MQTSSYGSAATSLATAKMVLKHDGIKGLYRGFGITIMREIPFTSLQFPLYEFLKYRLSLAMGARRLHASEGRDMRVGPPSTGSLSFLTGWLRNIKDPTSKMPSLLSRSRQIYIDEGMKALFAGVVPRTLWISAGGAVFLGAYEWVMGGLVDR
ncbi:mitochondrial carrier domain-containing protein [Boletus reticuloceps]|uniref:Mitochondrial carrier domain-containing protein n=1 Tax=Boletus reticuloceps TaxID=495285 RepID=A0A8I2YRL1_9AGAM|nr:mitochondrial carrier domain-containing protein [Boletus reticuloceps]